MEPKTKEDVGSRDNVEAVWWVFAKVLCALVIGVIVMVPVIVGTHVYIEWVHYLMLDLRAPAGN